MAEKQHVVWFKQVSKDDVNLVGGKGANLGEMSHASLPIPPGFVITAGCYKDFIERTNIKYKILNLVNSIKVSDTDQLEAVAVKIQNLITSTEIPKDICEEILEYYHSLSATDAGSTEELLDSKKQLFVAVRSSATAEDLAEASFAGQQASFLNVKGNDDLIKSVRECWASLYTGRAIYYRVRNNFDHAKVFIAVVVQKMVDSRASGVMFTVNPATNDDSEIVIEAVRGLGEAIVSGSVNPDLYIVNRERNQIIQEEVRGQDWQYLKDKTTGKTIKKDISDEEKKKRVLTDKEVLEIAGLGRRIHAHYNKPQDIEWAIEGSAVYIVQSRPVTTFKQAGSAESSAENTSKQIDVESEIKSGKLKVLVSGLTAAQGVASGPVVLVKDISELNKVKVGDVLVTKMTNPDMVPGMQKSIAIVTDEGGLTCIEGDAKLFTNKGFIKMKDIGDYLTNGQEIKTISLDANTKKVVWRRILFSMKRKAKALEIAPYLNSSNECKDRIRITADHKMPMLDCDTLKALPLGNIISQNRNLLLIDKLPKSEEKIDLDIFDKRKLLYLCGSIFSDGHIVKRKSGKPMRVMFSQKIVPEKEQYIDKVLHCFNSVFGAELKNYISPLAVVHYQDGLWQRAGSFECSQAYPAQTLQSLKDNFVNIISSVDEKYLTSFLGGIIDGDGHFNKQKSSIEIYINKKETKIIESIVVACLRLGAFPKLTEKGENLVVVKIKDKVDVITEECNRVKAVKNEIYDRKVFDFNIFDSLQLNDWRGNLCAYKKKNRFIGANWLLDYVKGRESSEVISKIKKLADSDLRMQRLVNFGETEQIDVYNVTIDAPSDEDHNYVVFTEYYTPILVFNCHAAIVSREMGKPCIVGTGNATTVLKEGQIVTVDAIHGHVYDGAIKIENVAPPKPMSLAAFPLETSTKIKVLCDLPEIAERAFATGADGVGLVRIEFMIVAGGTHPSKFIKDGKEQDYIDLLVNGIKTIADKFKDKSVWVRTSDIRTDEYRNLKGGSDEPNDQNPMIGWHGIRRALDEPGILKAEFKAIKKLHDLGYKNVGVMLPFVIRTEEVRESKKIMREIGLEPCKDVEFGVMVETPAACWIIEDMCREGISFISFGTNDLTQTTLGIDRDNERIAKLYDEMHPAVLGEIAHVVRTCRKYGVTTSICGQAGSRPDMAKFLVRIGIDSISANIDAVSQIRETVAHTERDLIMELIHDKYRPTTPYGY